MISSGGSGRPSASNPSSPHGSEFDDSSAHPSPSTTPTTPQKAPPQSKQDTLAVPGTLQVQVLICMVPSHVSPATGHHLFPYPDFEGLDTS